MRIVIDLQGAQAENCNRGIGRLSLSLAKHIAIHRGKHEIILALNGAFPDSIDVITDCFRGILPESSIKIWYPVGKSDFISGDTTWSREASELLRETFLASLNPSLVLVMSLFEGLVDSAVTSIGKIPVNYKTIVYLHDLIPLIHEQHYLANPTIREWYTQKFNDLKKSDFIVCNSESTRNEALSYGGFKSSSVVTVFAGKDEIFKPVKFSEETLDSISDLYGIKRPFIMYGGGVDYRKNIEGLIRSYAMLPTEIRLQHQLAIVCSIHANDKERLRKLAEEHGLVQDELVMTGFVPEEHLVALYNLCKAFVFPSWHEGFGLPALEAMACGKAVICSNCSSLPEVVGLAEATFDPFDDESIAKKMEMVLGDSTFRDRLEKHSIVRAKKFSWDDSAKLTLKAFENFVNTNQCPPCLGQDKGEFNKKRLAYVSPLPPEKSGISDYSAELLPELNKYYQIDLVLSQEFVDDAWISEDFCIRDAKWLELNADAYDCVLYHFGNSVYHQHMFDLLRKVPGIVVLHDFYLSGIVSHMEYHNPTDKIWQKALYYGHGYGAIHEKNIAEDSSDIVWKYPCNYPVLNNALGVIVHSKFSMNLAESWYGSGALKNWTIIPHLRHFSDASYKLKESARKTLGIKADAFVVCSFGLLGRTKLNHRLLDVWIKSTLRNDPNSLLIFVGENDTGDYGNSLVNAIKNSGCESRVKITGWTDSNLFQQYLRVADVAVQLRSLSRGETSGTVLDCMNHGIPTIVNSCGSMSDLDSEDVWILPEIFTDEQLLSAIEALKGDESMRRNFGEHAKKTIRYKHNPEECAKSYIKVIESFSDLKNGTVESLVNKLSELDTRTVDDSMLKVAATAIDRSIEPIFAQCQLFVDISELVQRDARTGIQRVVRALLRQLLLNPPKNFRVEPVYANKNQVGYRYARKFTLDLIGSPSDFLDDEPINFRSGDRFLGLDLQPEVVTAQKDFYQAMRLAGVSVQFVVYDLLLLQFPQFFIEGGEQLLRNWLDVILQLDGVVCISKSVAKDLRDLLDSGSINGKSSLEIGWFHLGSDLESSLPTSGVPQNAGEIINNIKNRPSFLMVGTIEPRKGHEQVLEAFEILWSEGHQVNLVIVGKQGWMVENLTDRLRGHCELNRHLFWLEDVSDEYLDKIYSSCSCLIAASYGEGFGLPLIEAAKHKLPILARDISVFREVAGVHACYFNASSSDALGKSIVNWLASFRAGSAPASDNMKTLSWKQSCLQLLDALGMSN